MESISTGSIAQDVWLESSDSAAAKEWNWWCDRNNPRSQRQRVYSGGTVDRDAGHRPRSVTIDGRRDTYIEGCLVNYSLDSPGWNTPTVNNGNSNRLGGDIDSWRSISENGFSRNVQGIFSCFCRSLGSVGRYFVSVIHFYRVQRVDSKQR